MKRALYLSLYILAGSHAPLAEAQSPEGCVSTFPDKYIGTYDGDFSGEVAGHFFLELGDLCDPPTIGQVSVFFSGPLAEYLNVGSFSTSACVFSGGAFTSPFPSFSFRIGGDLDFGTCAVSGTWTAVKPGDEQNPRSGEFTMALVDVFLETIAWAVDNGDFNNPANWSPPEIPATDQTALFIRGRPSAVSFGSPASSKGFRIAAGDVTFLTGSYSATGGSDATPSAIIGDTAAAVILRLASHNLTTAFSTIATDLGTGAEVTVESGSTWTEQGRMIVGQGGLAFLNINDEATVTSLETQIGSSASGDGTVNVSEDISFIGDETEWNAGSLAVGLAGKGTVNHYSGNMRSESAVLGVQAGSRGDVTIGSPNNSATWFLNGPLTVGDRGEGHLKIVEGGHIFVNAIIQLVVGSSVGGVGTVTIEGASTEIFAPGSFVVVGSDGTGSMSLKNGGGVASGFAIVTGKGTVRIENSKWETDDFSINDMGKVTLDNGTIEADDSFNLNFGGRLEGTGYVDTAEATLDGTIAPGVEVDAPKGLQQAGAIGNLTFGGNVDFASATLEIEVGGLAAGAFDVIHATGAVDIQNSTVVFRFIDGFLPRSGDTVPFLVADGGLTAANLVLEFEGVADGFQFEVTEVNGMLVFEALSDAQPDPTAAADLNGDNKIDAIDLLIFLNQLEE